VVDIGERFRDVLERYAMKLPGLQPRLEEVQQETQRLEQKIFSKIDITPQELEEMVAHP
jgi:hypothetical protein